MKRLLLLSVIYFGLVLWGWGQIEIAGWDFSALTGGSNNFGPSPFGATTTAANVTIGGLARSPGLGASGTGAAAAWGANNYTASGTLAGEISADKFWTFSIEANSGYTISLSEIVAYNIRRSSTGPSSGQWQYQIGDGTYTDIGLPLSYPGTTSGGNSMPAVDLSGISALQNVSSGTVITIRMVNYGATGTSGTCYYKDLGNSTANDLILMGTIDIITTNAVDNKVVCQGTSSIELTTTIFPDPSGGTVQFKIDGGNVGSPVTIQTGGIASYTYDPSALTAGDHNIGADFSGNGSYLASSGSGILTVFPASSATDYFRSKISGNWTDPSAWESSADGINWCDATSSPTNTANTIVVLDGHEITVTAPVTIDQTTVDAGGSLILNANLTLANGAGTDLIINGTVACGSYTVSGSGASFALNADATIKSGNANGLSGSITCPASFSTEANYVFNGNTTQNTSGMPSTVKTLTVANTGSSGNNYVVLWQNPTITGSSNSLLLQSGLLHVMSINIPANGQIISTGGNLRPGSYGGYFNCGNGGTVTVTGNIDFFEFYMYNGTNVTFSPGSTISGKLGLQTGAGTVNFPPVYLANSQLLYSVTSYVRGAEWSATSGNGYPYDVRLLGILTLNNGSPTVPVAMAGMLAITGGTLDMTGMQAPLTIGWLNGSGIIGSDQPGGDIKVNGVFWSCNGYVANGRKVIFQNPGTVTIQGSGAGTTFYDVDINKVGGAVTLGSNITVNGTLNLNDGIVTTNSYKVDISSTGSVAKVNGWINGTLNKYIAAGTTVAVTYETGDANYYTPIDVEFSSVTSPGSVSARSTTGDHPNIGSSTFNAAMTINRYYNLTKDDLFTFTNYSAIFNYNALDIDAGVNTSTVYCGKLDGVSWTYPSIGTRTSTSTQITGVSGFSDFQFGDFTCSEPDVPGVSANPPVICAGVGSTLTITSGDLNDGTAWHWYEGSCGGTPVGTGTSVSVNPIVTTTYYARGEGGCVTPGTCASVTVTVHPTAVFNGYLTYNNAANTALSGVQIALLQGAVTQHTANTGTGGYFSFPAVCPGVYDVVVTSGASAGGINSTDAAQVNYWSVHYGTIPVVRFLSGDVNGSQSILSNDAGNIQQHFITSGNPAVPFASDWVFWKTGETIGSNTGPAGYPTITITEGSTSLSQNFHGLVTGDFNRSFTPGAKEAGAGNITLIHEGVIVAGYNETIELPVFVKEEMTIGAISLILKFPSDLMQIENILLGNDPGSPVQFNVTGDELRMSWQSLSPVYLKAGEPLLTLMVSVTGDAGADGILISLAADPLNELADDNFDVIPNALLAVAAIHHASLGTDGGLTASDDIRFSNQPNPFRGTTHFIYSLPMEGKVIIEIYDQIGGRIQVLVDESQPAGSHFVTLEQNHLQPGVYAAVLRYENNGDVIIKTIKIISK
jgi:hypothetical protein